MLSRFIGAVVVAVGLASVASAQPMEPSTDFQGLPSTPATVAGSEGLYDSFGTNPDNPAAPFYRFWLTGEYYLATTSGSTFAPLVTTSPAANLGLPNLPGTNIVFGGNQDFGSQSGFRVGGGMWLDGCRAYGLEWGVSFLPKLSKSTSNNGSGADILARPFFDTVLQTQNSRLIASTGQFSGSVNTEYTTFYWNADLGSVMRVLETSDWSLEHLVGFRYFNIEDTLRITDSSSSLPGGALFYRGSPVFTPGATVSVLDYYSMINRWYGGAAGFRINYNPGRLQASFQFRMGVGANLQSLSTDGTTRLTGAGATQTTVPGFTTAAYATGNYTGTELSLAPELNLRLSYHVTQRIAVTAGYQYLYMTNVARLGDQVSNNLNPSAVPTSNTFLSTTTTNRNITIRQSDFWLHGFTAGIMLTF
jgi:Putative beta barrel porin-7 (BBP7)